MKAFILFTLIYLTIFHHVCFSQQNISKKDKRRTNKCAFIFILADSLLTKTAMPVEHVLNQKFPRERGYGIDVSFYSDLLTLWRNIYYIDGQRPRLDTLYEMNHVFWNLRHRSKYTTHRELEGLFENTVDANLFTEIVCEAFKKRIRRIELRKEKNGNEIVVSFRMAILSNIKYYYELKGGKGIFTQKRRVLNLQ